MRGIGIYEHGRVVIPVMKRAAGAVMPADLPDFNELADNVQYVDGRLDLGQIVQNGISRKNLLYAV
jgi:hypothetical protein